MPEMPQKAPLSRIHNVRGMSEQYSIEDDQYGVRWVSAPEIDYFFLHQYQKVFPALFPYGYSQCGPVILQLKKDFTTSFMEIQLRFQERREIRNAVGL